MANCDRWTTLKFFELIATIACLVCKRVTDDEASRLFLILQKISREWSLLNNVTWGKVGAAVADTTYGGYIIITAALFFGKLFGELPTKRRITEFILLGVGALLFIILGSLEFASLDSVPENLVDNAAVIGTLSLVTAGLFLLDMGGPKAKNTPNSQSQTPLKVIHKPTEQKITSQQVYNIEKDAENQQNKKEDDVKQTKNGHLMGAIKLPDAGGRYRDNMYKKMKEEKPKSFDIYGKDMHDGSDDEIASLPPKMEEHSPVWSKIRKGQYGKYDILPPSHHHPDTDNLSDDRPPSSPGDPGYVQYTAQHWGESVHKTPRQSPTQV